MKRWPLLSFFLFLLINCAGQTIYTIAGNGTEGFSGDGGNALTAQLKNPAGIVCDKNGNIYMADVYNNVIRKISASGIITTFAGDGIPGFRGEGTNASSSRLNSPVGMVMDDPGNIYFSDQNNARIRKIDPSGIITTIAGSGTEGYSGDGGNALAARLYIPGGVAVDKKGNIFFADVFNHVIRKINSNGIISTIAGNGKEGYSGDGGNALFAQLRFPVGVDVDAAGNIFIADTHNDVIRKVDLNGIITTIAGNSLPGYSGDGNLAASATLSQPVFIRFDAAGNLLIPEANNHVIRMINTSGIISTIAGNGNSGYSGDGGHPLSAQFSRPGAIVADGSGNYIVSDGGNFVLRKIIPCAAISNPAITITSSATEICQGELIKFSAHTVTPSTNPVYKWVVNNIDVGINKSEFSSTALKQGDQVTCIYSSGLNCEATSTSNIISITVNPKPVIDPGPAITIEPGNRVQLKANVSTPVRQYNWSPAFSLNNPSIANPVASPVETTTYHLDVISDKGCKADTNIKVTIFRKLYMPNAFTPNFDSRNDFFRIPAGATFELDSFLIYNAWGQIVFKTSNINNGWNGFNNGTPALAGIYVYIISGSDHLGKKIYKGSFMLLR